ncbi:hypothetical protein [Rhizobium sp. A37_96]
MGDVIYLKDDPDECDGEPKPKAAAMTISDGDAIALHEFMQYVSIRCYDERFKDRGLMKSAALRKHLERTREILDTLLDYPRIEPFYYWSPPSEMPADQAEPELISAIADRSDVHFHCVGIYLAPDSIHVGSLEIALDEDAGEACGIVSMRGMTSAPTWTKAGKSLDDTISIFVDAISFNQEGGAEPSA